jgi:hypothetical protein
MTCIEKIVCTLSHQGGIDLHIIGVNIRLSLRPNSDRLAPGCLIIGIFGVLSSPDGGRTRQALCRTADGGKTAAELRGNEQILGDLLGSFHFF